MQQICQVYRVVKVLPNGAKLLAPVTSTCQPAPQVLPEEDEIFNYCNTLCHWSMQIMHMSDTAAEGDLTRVIPNLMTNIPFFYSHSYLSKYFVECIDYILKVRQASPQVASRILEGSFVNARGGKGKNCESDLKTEHSVGNRKLLIKLLGANKTENAIARVTNAADILADIISKFDAGMHLGERSGRHTHSITEEQKKFINKSVQELKPFDKQLGRKCLGFSNMKFVYDKIKKEKMTYHLAKTTKRVLMGMTVETAEDDDIDEIDENIDEEDFEGLPDLP